MNRYTAAAAASLNLGGRLCRRVAILPRYGMPPLDGRVVSAAGQPLAGIPWRHGSNQSAFGESHLGGIDQDSPG
jgi:hypothetical protein